jgi:hypothetical protein
VSGGQRSFWSSIPGILTATAAFITAVGGLIGGLAAAGFLGSSTSHPSTPKQPPPPTSVRIEQVRSGAAQEGFFARDGTIITTNDPSNILGRPPLQAVWTEHGKKRTAAVEEVPQSKAGWVVRLRLVGGSAPTVEWGVGSAADLQPGARVTELGAAGAVGGHVRGTGVDVPYANGQTVRNLLVLSRVSAFGDGGAPVLDARGNVVGMVVGEEAQKTYAVPIETIRDDYPNSF